MMKIAKEETIHSKKHTTLTFDTKDGFIAFLFEQSKNPVRYKKDIELITGVRFKNHFSKLQEDIVEANAILLDFDGCLVPWEEVSHQLREWEHVVYSSYSNGTKTDKNGVLVPGIRFRVVIPFANPITRNVVNAYHHLWDFVTLALTDIKFGLDIPKQTAQSWFYLPAATDHNIWHHHNAVTLDPVAVINSEESQALHQYRSELLMEKEKNDAAFLAANPPPKTPLTASQIASRANKALTKWASADEGNAPFYSYVMALKGHGIEPVDIEFIASANLESFGKTPSERRKQLARIMKNL